MTLLRASLAMLLAAWATMLGCHRSSPEQALRAAFRQTSGRIQLPAGTIDLHAPLELAPGAHDIDVQGDQSGSILRLAADFQGAAAILGNGVSNVSVSGLKIIGNRAALSTAKYLPPSDVTFANYYDANGVIFRDSQKIVIRDISFQEIGGFPVLVSHCSGVAIDHVTIQDSGTLNAQGHSNTTGGILLEQGTTDFDVRFCKLHRIRGNGIWTHSNYRSPVNRDGVIAQNEIRGTPRDAIQLGHATHVQVLNNYGSDIGFPPAEADLPGGATPVAIDTAGDVSGSVYSGNRFEDVDGQCIDLDGFHDGQVLDNSCVNLKLREAYPLSHEGIVFGNSNPDMHSENVIVKGNLIQGFGYGGVYLIGRGHQITGNRFIDINRNHCTGDMHIAICAYAADEPAMLRSGIYFASHAARPADTQSNVIEHNQISGFGMDKWCVGAGPGVSLALNKIANNTCTGVR
ncbi:MAG TPA: right-handed parallel beta-helix repeat-containing protein [Bryobacteraceae bacterium]|nr:right-handed parallel beta-helix repeat-containing protein [Bryobacteraceae bacterium]